jgi:sulfur carrier protein
MNININGEARTVPDGAFVQDVLKEMGLHEKPVVVELNLEIVPREKWSGRRLNDGDQMEVIGFVGGGILSV